MKKKNKTGISTFESHLEKYRGRKGSARREKYEQEYEAFKLGIMLQELRHRKGLTQEELAQKCGTTKNYISRIENDASDIRLSTIIRIFQEGLNTHLKFSVSE